MYKMKKIVLISGGGHCRSCIDVIERAGEYKIAGIVDVPSKMGQCLFGYEIIATDEDIPQLAKEFDFFAITLGQIKSSVPRQKIYDLLKSVNASLPVIVSPLAYISKSAVVSEGSIIMHKAIINADANIGCNCIINTAAIVEHDAIIESDVHVSTGAIVNGGAVIRRGSFIGSNAVIREGISISSNSIIPACSFIKQDV